MQKLFDKLVIKVITNDFNNFKFLFENSIKNNKYDIDYIGNIEKYVDKFNYDDKHTELSIIHLLFYLFRYNKQIDLLSFLKLLLNNNVNINQKNSIGNTPLHEAIYSNNYSIIKLLIKKKVNVNSQNNKLETPLHIASLLGYSEIMYLLLENRANVNLMTSYGETALHYACYDCYDIMILNMLVDNGININLKDNEGYTSFHIICYFCQNIDFVVYLIENGTHINSQSKIGLTALHLIFLANHLDIEMKIILANLLHKHKANFHIKDSMNYTPLTLVEKYCVITPD